jgi:hypothetical protein
MIKYNKITIYIICLSLINNYNYHASRQIAMITTIPMPYSWKKNDFGMKFPCHWWEVVLFYVGIWEHAFASQAPMFKVWKKTQKS